MSIFFVFSFFRVFVIRFWCPAPGMKLLCPPGVSSLDLLTPSADVAEDAALVRRCLRGDAEAVGALVARFQAEVFGLCVRLLHHRHDAEDVTQEVFLRIFRSLRRWDPARPLRPWVMGITVNRCRTWLAQRVRRPELVDHLHETAPGPAPDDSAELVHELRLAVAALRPDYRSVFVLFHEQGLPYEEIAAALDRPVGTVKTWLHRARLEVLDQLKRRGMVEAEVPDEVVERGAKCKAKP
jgi:RNA polymerase sigma-70 factor (ECF subfamily)